MVKETHTKNRLQLLDPLDNEEATWEHAHRSSRYPELTYEDEQGIDDFAVTEKDDTYYQNLEEAHRLASNKLGAAATKSSFRVITGGRL